jgi:hypothetical protein
VWHGHRNGSQTDDPPDGQSLGQQAHRRDEPLPPQIRLQACEQQKRRADTVVQRVKVEFGLLVVGEMVGLERHQRTPGPVVEQFVDRKGRHQFGVQGVLQVLGGQLDGVPGVGKALQGVDQHRPAAVGGRQLRSRELQLVHPGLVRLVLLLWDTWLVSHLLRLLATGATVDSSGRDT